MTKIGRNEKCPCRSGKKYKHCCAGKGLAKVQPPTVNVTLMSGVKSIQADAEKRIAACRELGVFFFYSTVAGDAWLLEMTESDCVQVAKNGVALAPPIDENAEVIEINYSHTFSLVEKQLEIVAYEDKSRNFLPDAPTRELRAAIRRIKKKFTRDQLQKVHLPNPEKHLTT